MDSVLKTSELSITKTTATSIEYEGKTFLKIHMVKFQVTIDDGSVKRRANLWTCIEDGVKLPARVVVVPEFI